MGGFTKFFIKASEGEQVEAEVHVPDEKRGVVTGRVTDNTGAGIENACLILYDTQGRQDFAEYKLCDTVFTDTDGTFILGPLDEGALYAVYVYRRGGNIRRLDIKI